MPTADVRDSILVRSALELRDGEPLTVTQLAHRLGSSRTPVELAVTELLDSGVIRESGTEVSGSAGRPARRFDFAAGRGTIVGVDVGIGSLRVVATDLRGDVQAVRTFAGLPQGDGSAKFDAVVASIATTLSEANLPQALAAGLSVPGLIDAQGNIVMSSIIPEWSGADIAGQLARALRCPVAIENDVRLAAMAEHNLGAGRMVDDLVYVSVGRRIAMGLILDGRVRTGVHNAAGEVGHLTFRHQVDETGSLRWPHSGTAERLFADVAAGDEAAITELAAFVDSLAQGIAALAITVDPALIVVGGGLSAARDSLILPLAARLTEVLGLPIPLPLVAGRLGATASAYGAVVRAFDSHSTQIHGIPGLSTPTVSIGD